MTYRIAADAVLLVHFAFIAFVVLGALLALRWRWVALVQFPAAAWGAFVELTGRICPLTILENRLRVAAGASGYGESFVEHYLLAIVYPAGLTRNAQWVLAAVVLAGNGAIYAWMLWRRPPRAAPPPVVPGQTRSPVQQSRTDPRHGKR